MLRVELWDHAGDCFLDFKCNKKPFKSIGDRQIKLKINQGGIFKLGYSTVNLLVWIFCVSTTSWVTTERGRHCSKLERTCLTKGSCQVASHFLNAERRPSVTIAFDFPREENN